MRSHWLVVPVLGTALFFSCSGCGGGGPRSGGVGGGGDLGGLPTGDMAGGGIPLQCLHVQCNADADCDDKISCTLDGCVQGYCRHEPGPPTGPTACAAGSFCLAG